jgi:hypothetical protein
LLIIYDLKNVQNISADEFCLAALVDKEQGKLAVGEHLKIDCEVFSQEEIKRRMERVGFRVEKILTFPTIYAAITLQNAEELPDRKIDNQYSKCHYFSQSLFQLDKLVSPLLNEKGHYIVIIARKVI